MTLTPSKPLGLGSLVNQRSSGIKWCMLQLIPGFNDLSPKFIAHFSTTHLKLTRQNVGIFQQGHRGRKDTFIRGLFLMSAHEERIKKRPKETSLILQIGNSSHHLTYGPKIVA